MVVFVGQKWGKKCDWGYKWGYKWGYRTPTRQTGVEGDNTQKIAQIGCFLTLFCTSCPR